MPYAVIAPGIQAVYDSWEEVERIKILYPYPKFRKFETTSECWDFVRRNTYKRVYSDVWSYGETFDKLSVRMQYFIRTDKVYYNYFTGKMGRIALECNEPDVTVMNRSDTIKVILNDIHLNDDLIPSHMIAIWHGLRIIGDFVDVDILVPDHSIFYALMTYTGKNRIITRVRKFIDDRLARVSVSLPNFGNEEECDVQM